MKRTSSRILLLLLFTGFINISWAQNFTVSGTIADAKTNEPIAFANAALLRPSDSLFVRGGTTDIDGHFVIREVDAGKYILRVTYVGYTTYNQLLEVHQPLSLGTLSMKANATTLNAVQITAKKPVFAMDGEKNLYNVDQDPSVQTGTAADVLRNAPGVEVDAQGNITLRGVSSVDIWINDHPSNLNEESLRTYIKQLPANSIERIEVITNPSARYATKSGGGIINIVTNSKMTHNEFFSFGINAATMPYAGPWMSYVYAKDKLSLNLYANVGYSKFFYNTANMGDIRDTTGRLVERLKDTANYNGVNKNIYLQANIDYQFDSMNMLSSWFGGSLSMQDINMLYQSSRTNMLNNTTNVYQMTMANNNPYTFAYGGVWYQHKFNNEGHQISINLGGSGYSGNSFSNSSRIYTDIPTANIFRHVSEKSMVPSGTINVDYTIPYSKNGDIQIGIATERNYENTHFLAQDSSMLTQGLFQTDSLRTANHIFNDHSFDSYITAQQRVGNLTIKAGLRFECKYLTGVYDNTTQTESNVHKSYYNWRPSLHLSYRTEDMHNFNLSYSRSDNTPSSSQLSTFCEYSTTEETFSTGNPHLKVSYTNNFEGGWTKYFTKFGSVGVQLYHRNSIREINNLTDVVYSDVFGHNVSFTQDVNLGNSYNTGAELNITYSPQAFLNVRLYTNVFNNKFSGIFRGVEYNQDKTSISARLALWAKLWKKVDVFASANYSSSTISLFAEDEPSYSMDCGFSADLFDRKMSIYVNAQDIFNTMKQASATTNPYYTSNSSAKFSSQFLAVGVTVRLGKMELESKAKQGGNSAATPSAPILK